MNSCRLQSNFQFAERVLFYVRAFESVLRLSSFPVAVVILSEKFLQPINIILYDNLHAIQSRWWRQEMAEDKTRPGCS